MSRVSQAAARPREKHPGWPPGTLLAVRRPAWRMARGLGAAWVRRCGQMREICPNLVSTSSRRLFGALYFYPTYGPPQGIAVSDSKRAPGGKITSNPVGLLLPPSVFISLSLGAAQKCVVLSSSMTSMSLRRWRNPPRTFQMMDLVRCNT